MDRLMNHTQKPGRSFLVIDNSLIKKPTKLALINRYNVLNNKPKNLVHES